VESKTKAKPEVVFPKVDNIQERSKADLQRKGQGNISCSLRLPGFRALEKDRRIPQCNSLM